MMFTNVWYVAESSDNIKDQPVRVKMLGRDFVLFRDQNGTAVCLSGVCPHRGADLAQGASFEESVEAIEVGIVMGGSPAVTSAHFAFHALDRVYSREILKI